MHATYSIGRKRRRKSLRKSIRIARDVTTAVLVNQRMRQAENGYNGRIEVTQRKEAADTRGTRSTIAVTLQKREVGGGSLMRMIGEGERREDITVVRSPPEKVAGGEEGRRSKIKRGGGNHRDPGIKDMTVPVISTCTLCTCMPPDFA